METVQYLFGRQATLFTQQHMIVDAFKKVSPAVIPVKAVA